MGVDVVSPGELYTAVKAGFPMENAYFHGSSKTDEDIRFAMEHKIGFFICDNADELDAIDAEAARQGICQKILLRLAPGIDPHTHQKINTGRVDSKFGVAIETGQAEQLVKTALEKENVQVYFSTLVDGYEQENGSLTGLRLRNDITGEVSRICVDGAVLAVGLMPENDAFAHMADLNDWGYFDSAEDCLTETAGLFVAGDCRSKRIRQVVTAAGDGAVAAMAACSYLDQNG